jgi:trimeric autotransporter adhesin
MLLLLLAAGAAAEDHGPTRLVALTLDGTLMRFTTERPIATEQVRASGVRGHLVGLDYRPADGKLYAVSDASDIYTLDVVTGVATLVSTLTVPFDTGGGCGVDFNPQADRLRLIGRSGQNLRVHVGLGATANDAPVAYAHGDRNFGVRPEIVGAAYTRALPNASETKLFDIDAGLDVLALQDPPNDGTLVTVGPLGVDAGAATGFDIRSDPDGGDQGVAAIAGILYEIDLATGAARPLGTIGSGGVAVVGLAVVPGALDR